MDFPQILPHLLILSKTVSKLISEVGAGRHSACKSRHRSPKITMSRSAAEPLDLGRISPTNKEKTAGAGRGRGGGGRGDTQSSERHPPLTSPVCADPALGQTQQDADSQAMEVPECRVSFPPLRKDARMAQFYQR